MTTQSNRPSTKNKFLNNGLHVVEENGTYKIYDKDGHLVSASAVWGAITGTLADQTDLKGKLDELDDGITSLEEEIGSEEEAGTILYKIAQKQDKSNLVTAFQATPDDTHYPSEKLTYDRILAKNTVTPTLVTVENLTITELQCMRMGNIVDVRLRFTSTAAIAETNIATGMPKPIITPVSAFFDSSSVYGRVTFGVPSGNLRLSTTGAMTWIVTFTYLTEDSL